MSENEWDDEEWEQRYRWDEIPEWLDKFFDMMFRTQIEVLLGLPEHELGDVELLEN